MEIDKERKRKWKKGKASEEKAGRETGVYFMPQQVRLVNAGFV